MDRGEPNKSSPGADDKWFEVCVWPLTVIVLICLPPCALHNSYYVSSLDRTTTTHSTAKGIIH